MKKMGTGFSPASRSRAAVDQMESALRSNDLIEHRIYPETGSHFRVRCSKLYESVTFTTLDRFDPSHRDLEHIPPKWEPVRREEYAQGIECARILIDRMIPSDRKAR
jgi:hypothetical protein